MAAVTTISQLLNASEESTQERDAVQKYWSVCVCLCVCVCERERCIFLHMLEYTVGQKVFSKPPIVQVLPLKKDERGL